MKWSILQNYIIILISEAKICLIFRSIYSHKSYGHNAAEMGITKKSNKCENEASRYLGSFQE